MPHPCHEFVWQSAATCPFHHRVELRPTVPPTRSNQRSRPSVSEETLGLDMRHPLGHRQTGNRRAESDILAPAAQTQRPCDSNPKSQPQKRRWSRGGGVSSLRWLLASALPSHLGRGIGRRQKREARGGRAGAGGKAEMKNYFFLA